MHPSIKMVDASDKAENKMVSLKFDPFNNARKYNNGRQLELSVSFTALSLCSIAYYVEVHIDESSRDQDKHGLSPEMRLRSTVGAVKVAVRSLSMGAGPSKS